MAVPNHCASTHPAHRTSVAQAHCSQVTPVHCSPVAPVCCVPATGVRCSSELWIAYHQASRSHKQMTAQLIDCSDLYDLEDVLDYIFQQGFVDSKWRSVVWWEDCTFVRLKACDTIRDLLARGAGSTPNTALRLIRMSHWLFGCTTNTCTPDNIILRPSVSALIYLTPSVSAWRTSRTTSSPRVIFRERRVDLCAGRARAGGSSTSAPRSRTCFLGARGSLNANPSALLLTCENLQKYIGIEATLVIEWACQG
ncbi:hypothetical protein BGW80DRAFT_478298 [Lactifluus volemus]|nr:hypothetical protein BGW80DRAFT_478298 [Lactifluus volemus]